MTDAPAADLPGLDAGYGELEQEVLDAIEAARVALGGAPWADAIVAQAPEHCRHLVIGMLARLGQRGRIESLVGTWRTRYRDVFVSRGRWEVAL